MLRPAPLTAVLTCPCGRGAADATLAQKLKEELEYEKEASEAGEPDFLKTFKAQGVWTVRILPVSCRPLLRGVLSVRDADRGCRRKRRGLAGQEVRQREVRVRSVLRGLSTDEIFFLCVASA